MCKFWELGCKLQEVAVEAADSAVSQFAQSVLEGINNTLVSVGTAWVNVPTLNLRAANGPFQWVATHTEWVLILMITAATMFVFARMAFTRSAAGVPAYMTGVFSFIVVSGAGVAGMALLVEVADQSATWFIRQASMDQDFAVAILDVVGSGTIVPGGVGFMVVIVGGLLGLIANLVQIGLIFIRNVLLVLIGAFLILSFALPGTNVGKAWSKQLVGWFGAFLLYKPVASIIYAIGIKTTAAGALGSGFDELATFMVGVCILVFAPLALPALLAFVVPTMSAMTAGGGGGGAGVAMAAGAAATGAVNVAKSSSARTSQESQSAGGSSGGAQSAGASGGEGASGASAAAGSSGSSGTSGSSGATGTAAVGTSGSSGATGSSGSAGAEGASGSAGTAGSSGSAGATGASSGAGSAGASGSAGAAGTAAAGAATGGAIAAVQGVKQAVGAVQGTVTSQTQGPTGASEAGETRG